MKLKKYLLSLILVITISCNYVSADTICYYISNGFSAKYDYSNNKVYVNKVGSDINSKGNKENIKNSKKSVKINGWEMPAYQGDGCPSYLVLSSNKNLFGGLDVYATNDISIANKAIEVIGSKKKHYGFVSSKQASTMTEEEYISKYAVSVFPINSSGLGEPIAELDCESLFGDKDDPESLAYLINSLLDYVRIIVPILVILFGTIDMAKAVIAGKEDEMKKAQTSFIKRLVIGVAVFFVPLLVNLIMELADIVWEGLGYTTCGL